MLLTLLLLLLLSLLILLCYFSFVFSRWMLCFSSVITTDRPYYHWLSSSTSRFSLLSMSTASCVFDFVSLQGYSVPNVHKNELIEHTGKTFKKFIMGKDKMDSEWLLSWYMPRYIYFSFGILLLLHWLSRIDLLELCAHGKNCNKTYGRVI